MVTVLVFSLGAAAYGVWVWKQLDSIPRFTAPISTPSPELVEPSATDPTAFLVFSVGSKGMDKETGRRIGIGAGRASMADGLTDSLMLVLTNPRTGQAGVISIPRDTYIASHGRRINEAYNVGGIEQLVSEVEELTGIRATHQVAVNFAAFADLTTAVGGIDIWQPEAIRDEQAKLEISIPGCIHLEGADALAFARSRHWHVIKSDGGFGYDATSSDWGRIERQQALLRALSGKLVNPSLPLKVPALLTAAQNNLTLDQNLTTSTLIGFARAFATSGLEISAATIPGRGRTINGASVIEPDLEGALSTVAKIATAVGFPLPGQVVAADASANATDTSTSTSTTSTATSAASPATLTPPQASRVLPNGHISSSKISTDISPTAGARSSAKPWAPDNGNGAGGTRYPTCTGGHLPHP